MGANLANCELQYWLKCSHYRWKSSLWAWTIRWVAHGFSVLLSRFYHKTLTSMLWNSHIFDLWIRSLVPNQYRIRHISSGGNTLDPSAESPLFCIGISSRSILLLPWPSYRKWPSYLLQLATSYLGYRPGKFPVRFCLKAKNSGTRIVGNILIVQMS